MSKIDEYHGLEPRRWPYLAGLTVTDSAFTDGLVDVTLTLRGQEGGNDRLRVHLLGCTDVDYKFSTLSRLMFPLTIMEKRDGHEHGRFSVSAEEEGLLRVACDDLMFEVAHLAA